MAQAILKQVKAVLFDLFDTLLLIRKNSGDFNEKCVRNVYVFLNKRGINVSYENFRRAYSEARRQIYEKISGKLEEPHFSVRISLTLLKLGYNYEPSSCLARGAAEAYMEEFSHYVYLDDDAIPVLCELRTNGYKTGVISNFAIPEGAHKLIASYRLKDLLDTVIISGEANRRKPSPEIFNLALKELGIKASEAIFVGDTPDIDIRGAKNAGMKTILIKRGEAKIDSGEDSPDFTIRSLKEILRILNKT